MTSTLVSPAATEFPTLDLAQLEDAPSKPAVVVPTIDRGHIAMLLAEFLTHVVPAYRPAGRLRDEHKFIDTHTHAAVRYVLSVKPGTNELRATVQEIGPRGLWDQLVVLCDNWERAGRPILG